jgi:hypothetical protein
MGVLLVRKGHHETKSKNLGELRNETNESTARYSQNCPSVMSSSKQAENGIPPPLLLLAGISLHLFIYILRGKAPANAPN